MSSGELRFFVEIQRFTTDASTTGDTSSKTWVKHADAWASIQSMAGRESAGDIDSTMGKAKIKIRYRDDITNKMRVVYDGINYEIEDNFDLNGRRKYLMMITKVLNK